MSLAGEDTMNSKKGASWLHLSWGVRFTIAVTGSIFAWWCQIHWVNGVHSPTVSAPGGVILWAAPFMLCSALSILLPVWALFLLTKVLSRSGKLGSILSSVLLLSFSLWIMNSLFKDWFGAQHGGSLLWRFGIVFVAAILLYPLPIMRMKRKAVRLASLGDYEGAMRISKRWLRSKVYGRPFQGWIALQAGRFDEAMELMKDSAFDAKGRPVLKGQHLYFYVIALMSDEKYSEAQGLLEAALLAPHKVEPYLRFSLAECLLSQKKEAPRARDLVEKVIATLKGRAQSAQSSTFLAQCLALHAWALACCGDRKDAEAGLDDAFAVSNSLGSDDLAGLLHLKGATWRALGDSEKARAAFQQALEVFPHGGIALQARRELTKLGQNERD
jgi:tetratricopeptide (TPR) repeat protein